MPRRPPNRHLAIDGRDAKWGADDNRANALAWCAIFASSKRSAVKISVIIPTFNRAHVLPRAIDSVLCQTFKQFELIIVDDASTDGSERIS